MSEWELSFQTIEKLGKLGVDVWSGLQITGGKDVYQAVLWQFRDNANVRINSMELFLKKGDYDNLHIQIHALKNAARMIGAENLAEKALEAETAVKLREKGTLVGKTNELLLQYKKLATALKKL